MSYTGQCMGGPDEGNYVTATEPEFRHVTTAMTWLDGPDQQPAVTRTVGLYIWQADTQTFKWEMLNVGH